MDQFLVMDTEPAHSRSSNWVAVEPDSALSRLDFRVGRSLRCQAVVSQPHGIHRPATVATPGRALG